MDQERQVLTLDGRAPGKQVIPTQVQIHQGLLAGNVEGSLESAGDAVVLEDALFIPRRVALDLLGPLAHIVEVVDAYTPIVVMDTAHDIIASLSTEKEAQRVATHHT